MSMKMDLGTSGLELKPFLAITCLFWLYATVSAVLYTYGLSVSFSELTDEPLFAAWPMRVAQYLILLPPLLGCYGLSLRLGWRPVGRTLPLQIGLGVVFALLARPALAVAMMLFGAPDEHDNSDLDETLDWIGLELFTAWLASFMDFLIRYGFGLALLNSFAGYKRLRDAELRVTALEQQWGSARLAALRRTLAGAVVLQHRQPAFDAGDLLFDALRLGLGLGLDALHFRRVAWRRAGCHADTTGAGNLAT